MGRACSTYGNNGVRRGFWWENPEERDYFKVVGGKRIILK
jgi:hypothetical protein